MEDLYVTVCSNFFIFGDFNVDVSVPSYLCSCLCNVTCQYGLSIIPTSHTHVATSSATTIDLMLASSPESVMSCETVPPLGTSDNNGILTDISLRTPLAAPQVSRNFKVWRYKYVDFERAQEMLSQIDYNSVVVEGDVNASWKNWERMFLNIMEICIPTTTVPTRRNLPWLSKSILQLIKKRNMYYRKSKQSPHYFNKHRLAQSKALSHLRCERRQYLQQLQTGSK